MDLNTIIMHLDNFVDTWKGWGDVFEGLTGLSSNDQFDTSSKVVSGFDGLSSLSSLTSLSSDAK